MRQDSLAEFEKAGRTDLIDQAKAEIEVLQNIFRPQWKMTSCKALLRK